MNNEGYGGSTPVTEEKPIAELRNVSKRFGSVLAASDLNLKISKGEFLSFLGPSGCGKTTALRMLAGFEAPSEGDVLLDGEVVNTLDAHLRPVNMVFQHYALFPHMGGFESRRIWEMSGGQQQRVALARAIINEPKLLLLDEPMAALDRKLRKEMQIELQNLQRQLGITFILVTHDQEEALSMSDRICVMKDGKIVQIGSPQEPYDRPRNRHVAGFVGTSNFFDGKVTRVAGERAGVCLNNGVEVEGSPVSQVSVGQNVSVSVRPEQINLHRTGEGMTVKVLNRIFLGEHTEYFVKHDTLGEFLVLSPRQLELNDGPFNTGDVLFASWEAGAALVLGRN